MAHIVQVAIGYGRRTGEAALRAVEAQPHRRVDLGECFLCRHLDLADVFIGATLDAALHIVVQQADSEGDAHTYRRAFLFGIGIGKVQATGHLYIVVIGAVFDFRFFAVDSVLGCSIDQQGMDAVIGGVIGKAEGPAEVGSLTLFVVSYGNAKGRGYVRPFLVDRVLHQAGPGNIRIADHGLHAPVYPVHAHRCAQGALNSIFVGPGAALPIASVPTHGGGAGPASVPDVVAGPVVQAAITLGTAQVQCRVVNHGGGIAIDLVPGDAARGRDVEAVVGIFVLMLHLFQVADGGAGHKLERLVEKIVRGGLTGAEKAHERHEQLAFLFRAKITPFIDGFQHAVVLGTGRTLQGDGVNDAAVVRVHLHVADGDATLGAVLRLGSHGSDQAGAIAVMVAVRIHVVRGQAFGTPLNQMAGLSQCIFSFNLVLFFRALALEIIGSGICSIGGSVRAAVGHRRDAVVVQQVQGKAHADIGAGIGGAQSQAAHHIGDGTVVLGLQRQGARRVHRGLVVHQNQRIAFTNEGAGAAGEAQGVVRLARRQDDAHLVHVVLGVHGNVAIRTVGGPGFQGYILAGQDEAVAGEFLRGDAGPYAVAVGLGETEIFRAVARAADHVHLGIRVHRDALAGADGAALAQGHHALVLELGDIEGYRRRQLVLVVVRNVAANIVIRVGSGVHHVEAGRNQSLDKLDVGIDVIANCFEIFHKPLYEFFLT